MSKEIHPANQTGNGGYERRDIGVAPVLYFMLGFAVAGLLVYFLVDGIYSDRKEIHPANQTGNGGYERRDIGVAPVLYFMLGLAVAGLLVYFLVDGIYSYLEKRSETQHTPLTPLVTNAPPDPRKLH